MDITDLVQSQWLTSTDVKNSPTKIVTIVSAGTREEATNTKGEKYKAFQIQVELDKVQKIWRVNKFSLKKLADRFGTDTSSWLGKQVAVTNMLMQNGKEGISPI